MKLPSLKRCIVLAAFVAFALGVTWWGLQKVDSTSSAIFISDSPDGKYRCAVFCNDNLFGGHPEYSAGLFDGHWPHRELSGPRAEWNHDSISSSDFRPVWRPNGVDINFKTGYGDDRATVSGLDVGGGQTWGGR